MSKKNKKEKRRKGTWAEIALEDEYISLGGIIHNRQKMIFRSFKNAKKFLNTRETKNYNVVKHKIVKQKFYEYKKIYPYEHYLKFLIEKKKRELRQGGEKHYVYFMGNLKYKFCKIGYSNNPNKRLSSIQIGCPFTLEIIKTIEGSQEREKKTQKYFKKYKERGEWYRIEGELKDYLLNDKIWKNRPY